MGKRNSTEDRLKLLTGLVNALLPSIQMILELFGKLLTPLLAPKCRLLRPDRFAIRAEERRHLKGREEEISELTDLCERQPLVFLEGEPGSGKSALVRAGLLDECHRRRRLHPVYVDLSGADWEERLATLLCGEVWLALSHGDRETLELKCPSPPGRIFALLANIGSRLGRTPLLIFDQFDDYQGTYRRRFREGGQANTWITHETLAQINWLWREAARALQDGAIHCLFISRTDNAAGLDAVRFVDARTYRLARVSRNLIAPLLEEVTIPDSAGRSVVAHPERGWELLKGRLLGDLAEDDCILPIQLSIALQALRRLPVLTVWEYERRGGAEGLERFHIEQNLVEASQISSLPVEQVRKILVSLVDPVKHKSIQMRTGEILAVLDQGSGSTNESQLQHLLKALESLEDRAVLRRRPAENAGEDVWLLQHDFLCRGVLSAERYANRWRVVLQEQAAQYGEATSILRRWTALLSPWQQVRLVLQRLSGKLRYAGERRFALLSTLRFLPYVLVLLMVWGASVAYRDYEEEQQASRLFTAITAKKKYWRPEVMEADQARNVASVSTRVRWKMLQLAFADEKQC